MQEEGCKILACLCAGEHNVENRRRSGGAGGVEAIVEAMRKHPDVAVVQENACGALRNLAVNDEAQGYAFFLFCFSTRCTFVR